MRPLLHFATFAAGALVSALPVCAAQPLPDSVVGIWAIDGSEFRGRLLMKGQALYFGRDGIGAIVGGPPPIGFKVVARFDTQTNQIEFDGYEGEAKVLSGKLQFDPTRRVIFYPESPTKPLKRISPDFTSDDKCVLGIPQ
jgi:hypothetical protein